MLRRHFLELVLPIDSNLAFLTETATGRSSGSDCGRQLCISCQHTSKQQQ